MLDARSRPALQQLQNTESCGAWTNSTGYYHGWVAQDGAVSHAHAEAAAGDIHPALQVTQEVQSFTCSQGMTVKSTLQGVSKLMARGLSE